MTRQSTRPKGNPRLSMPQPGIPVPGVAPLAGGVFPVMETGEHVFRPGMAEVSLGNPGFLSPPVGKPLSPEEIDHYSALSGINADNEKALEEYKAQMEALGPQPGMKEFRSSEGITRRSAGQEPVYDSEGVARDTQRFGKDAALISGIIGLLTGSPGYAFKSAASATRGYSRARAGSEGQEYQRQAQAYSGRERANQAQYEAELEAIRRENERIAAMSKIEQDAYTAREKMIQQRLDARMSVNTAREKTALTNIQKQRELEQRDAAAKEKARADERRDLVSIAQALINKGSILAPGGSAILGRVINGISGGLIAPSELPLFGIDQNLAARMANDAAIKYAGMANAVRIKQMEMDNKIVVTGITGSTARYVADQRLKAATEAAAISGRFRVMVAQFTSQYGRTRTGNDLGKKADSMTKRVNELSQRWQKAEISRRSFIDRIAQIRADRKNIDPNYQPQEGDIDAVVGLTPSARSAVLMLLKEVDRVDNDIMTIQNNYQQQRDLLDGVINAMGNHSDVEQARAQAAPMAGMPTTPQYVQVPPAGGVPVLPQGQPAAKPDPQLQKMFGFLKDFTTR